MSGYDSEFGRDAWKKYLRIIEANDTPMYILFQEFGQEMYEQALDDAVQRVEALVAGPEWRMPDIIAAIKGGA